MHQAYWNEQEKQRFERKYGSQVESPLSDLEAEVTRLYDAGLDTPEKILETLSSAWQLEGKAKSSEILDAPCAIVNVEDIRIILRNYKEYLRRFSKRTGPGRPRKLTWQGYRFLMRLLHHHPKPSNFGYKEKGWT